MPTWIAQHRADISFVVSTLAGVGLIAVGIATDDSPTILLGAGALGIGGFNEVVEP